MKYSNTNIIPILSSKDNSYIYDACSNIIIYSPIPYKKLNKSLINICHDGVDDKNRAISRHSSKEVSNYIELIEKLKERYACFCHTDNTLKTKYDKDFFLKEIHNVGQLILEVTQKCNFRCFYCIYSGKYNYLRSHSNRSMTFEIAKKSIDIFRSLVRTRQRSSNPISIAFYGGEPLIEFPLITKCVKYIYEKFNKEEVYLLITTNGSILNDKIAAFLVNNRIHINISLDGPADEHDKNRIFQNGKGTFNTVWNNISYLKKYYNDYYSKYVGFQITISKNHKIKSIKRFFEIQGLISSKKTRINSVYEGTNYEHVKEYIEQKVEIKELYRLYKTKIIKRKQDIFLDAYFEQDFHDLIDKYYRPIERIEKFTATCFPACQKIFVSSVGDFHACEKINHYFPFGDYKKGIDIKRILSIWNQYETNVCKSCFKCISVQFCHVCMATVAKDGYFDASEECEYYRKRVPSLIKEFIDISEQQAEAFVTENAHK